MPRSILRISIRMIYLVFEVVQTNENPAFYFVFQTSFGRFCILSDRSIGHISRTNKKRKRQPFHLLAGA